MLLGADKYVWHGFHTSIPDEDKALFTLRFQSTNIDGMKVPPIRAAYIMQYRNGLIGKHFKTLMQTMAFHVHGLDISEDYFSLILAIGELGALLWIPEITDMKVYTEDLNICIANVLDAFAAVEPSKIMTKIKLHLLTHLPEDVRRFGPAVRNSTETFECYNAIFRLCSIQSNHQAPSRDIATKIAAMDRMKHVISGGYWKKGLEWVQAGDSVRSILIQEPVIQNHLGWVPEVKSQPGTVKRLAKLKAYITNWNDTLASKFHPDRLLHGAYRWRSCKAVISQSGDPCEVGSWVVFHDSGPARAVCIGRIKEIIEPLINIPGQKNDTPVKNLVTIELFQVGENLHPDFRMPVLHRAYAETGISKKMTTTSERIQFIINVQHDCRLLDCKVSSGEKFERQEHCDTDCAIQTIDHADDDSFVINTHSLHNAGKLRSILPRSLIAPKYIHADRRAFHDQVAAKLRISHAKKQKEAQEKRKATNNAKKADKEAAQTNTMNASPEDGCPSHVPEVAEAHGNTDATGMGDG